jgi:cobyrinic acid a,c-diamide synthase
MNKVPRLILAAPMSGSGKTTVTAGLIAALVGRGLKVAPFKCGPDYIDPSYHALAANQPCTNLDAWLIPPHYIARLLAQRAADVDIALIEGVMGLFDGHAGEDDTGSTAHVARLTHTPVIIVLDVRGMGRTAAALVAGLRTFDPSVQIAGVILNRVGSARHAQMVTRAIESNTNIPVFGYLLRDSKLTLPERHLGLVPTSEPGEWQEWIAIIRTQSEATIDLDRLLTLASSAPELPTSVLPYQKPSTIVQPRPVIAVARDAAFTFRYQDNLDLLTAAGAELAFFSPLTDSQLPPGSQAIYLCGGFPELYADSLSKNEAMLVSLHEAADRGLPIYAECGGLIYLTEGVVDSEGRYFPLAGLLPGRTKMAQRVTLGYRQVQACADSWLLRAGETMRGHEFHYSTWQHETEALPALYQIQPDAFRPQPRLEGAHCSNILASYIHLHFLAMPELATRFVEAARVAPRI